MRVIVQLGSDGSFVQHSFDLPGRDIHCSHILICCQCIRIWGTIQRIPSDPRSEGFMWPEALPCENCPWPERWRFGVPGSILFDDETYLEVLPPALLKRELSLHLSYSDTSMLTPEDLSKLQLYRARITGGEQMPMEEQREAIRLLRNDRVNASKRAQASKASGTKAAKAPVRSAAELLGKLGIPGL